MRLFPRIGRLDLGLIFIFDDSRRGVATEHVKCGCGPRNCLLCTYPPKQR